MIETERDQSWSAWTPAQASTQVRIPNVRLFQNATWLPTAQEEILAPAHVPVRQPIPTFRVFWQAPGAQARLLRPLFEEWPAVYRPRLAALGEVYVFTEVRSWSRAGAAAREVRSEPVPVLADPAQFERWDAIRNTFADTVAELAQEIGDEWAPAGRPVHRPWWQPSRRRAWQESMQQRFERLSTAYEAYRPALPEIEAAIQDTKAARTEVTAALQVVNDWCRRTRWWLVQEQERFRIVREELAVGTPVEHRRHRGSLHDVRQYAYLLRHQNLKAIFWDQPSLDLCARELTALSAELPTTAHEPHRRSPRNGQTTWRRPALTASGQPMVYLRPATFALVYRSCFGFPLDELTNGRQLDQDRKDRRKQQKAHRRRPSAGAQHAGGSWPTDVGGVGDHAGGGDYGGGYSSGGHSGGFGGSF
ncbi:hypothetical protein LWF15_33155 [Kineosporia rhizophila]|uniref:hypothetical protein n=1 Tax=Kineosporia rhizophila TaxID=84633 RepID=UPI001E563CA1|nr:hypothetical protein [Kineosporia rhizophila]MCE0540353.1 hypothetical protein [Kineosporia rhizophila]